MPGLDGVVSAEVTGISESLFCIPYINIKNSMRLIKKTFIFKLGPDGIIIPCSLTKLSNHLYRVEIRTRFVGTYSVVFSNGSKIVSSQILQAFDPSKIIIKEISDVVCHRPGTIIGNFFILTKLILKSKIF